MDSALAYRHPGYAASYNDSAEVLWLEHCDGWLVRRHIDGSSATDLANPYPLFCCKNLSAIDSDLIGLDTTTTASLVIRTDAFSQKQVSRRLTGFDNIFRFKTHYIARFDQPWRSFARRNCRRLAARAKLSFDFRRVEKPATRARVLWELNQVILKRRNATQEAQLSQETLATQLTLPGVTLFEAHDERGVQAAACFMEVGEYAYAHLLGSSNQARDRFVVYGLYGHALDYYQQRVQAIDFGGAVGINSCSQDGLSQFKQGWCNQTGISYLCCKILNRDLYQEICRRRDTEGSAFFPAYRSSITRHRLPSLHQRVNSR